MVGIIICFSSQSVLIWRIFRVPQNVGDNRFGNWLANARDWNVSRNRYWGTPIPLWASEDMEEVCRLFFCTNNCN